eukprot:2573599-Pleurochrysis_carterae.AAC.1
MLFRPHQVVRRVTVSRNGVNRSVRSLLCVDSASTRTPTEHSKCEANLPVPRVHANAFKHGSANKYWC